MITHNPIKSDVYSLGKIIEHSVRTVSAKNIQNLYVSECMMLLLRPKTDEWYLQSIPSLLEVMIEPEEEFRFSSVELLLLIGNNDWFTGPIRVPYERFFEKKVQKVNMALNSARVEY
jgi:hypothetical protein